jgi:hypothetical protein
MLKYLTAKLDRIMRNYTPKIWTSRQNQGLLGVL